MQAAKRDCNAPPTRDLNIWLCGRVKLYLDQSIGNKEPNTIQQKKFSSMKTLCATGLGCEGVFRICMPSPSTAAFIVPKITAFTRTDVDLDLDRLG